MALLVCKSCKKAFISSLQEENFCPDCVIRLRELYPSVRNFLKNHCEEAYTTQDVSRIMGIELRDVDSLVSMGLLERRKSHKARNSDKDSLYARSHKEN